MFCLLTVLTCLLQSRFWCDNTVTRWRGNSEYRCNAWSIWILFSCQGRSQSVVLYLWAVIFLWQTEVISSIVPLWYLGESLCATGGGELQLRLRQSQSRGTRPRMCASWKMNSFFKKIIWSWQHIWISVLCYIWNFLRPSQ